MEFAFPVPVPFQGSHRHKGASVLFDPMIDGGATAIELENDPLMGPGWRFDASTDVWSSAQTRFSNSNELVTLACWVRINALPSSTTTFLGLRDSANSSRHVTCAIFTGGPSIRGDYGGSATSIAGGINVSAGDLVHVAVVSNGANGGSLYVNGIADGTSAVASNSNTTSRSLFLGGAGNGMDFTVYDVRLYGRALSAGEIAYLYLPQTRWSAYGLMGKTACVLPTGAAASASLVLAVGARRGMQFVRRSF